MNISSQAETENTHTHTHLQFIYLSGWKETEQKLISPYTFYRFSIVIYVYINIDAHNDARFIVNDTLELNKTDVIHASILFSWLKNYIWQLSDGSDLHTWFDVSWILFSIVIYDRLLFFFHFQGSGAVMRPCYWHLWICKYVRWNNMDYEKAINCSAGQVLIWKWKAVNSASAPLIVENRQHKTLLIDRINFIKTLFNLNSIFLHFNGKSSLFNRAEEFSAFIFLRDIWMADKMECH